MARARPPAGGSPGALPPSPNPFALLSLLAAGSYLVFPATCFGVEGIHNRQPWIAALLFVFAWSVPARGLARAAVLSAVAAAGAGVLVFLGGRFAAFERESGGASRPYSSSIGSRPATRCSRPSAPAAPPRSRASRWWRWSSTAPCATAGCPTPRSPATRSTSSATSATGTRCPPSAARGSITRSSPASTTCSSRGGGGHGAPRPRPGRRPRAPPPPGTASGRSTRSAAAPRHAALSMKHGYTIARAPWGLERTSEMT